ncbi:hypothetical protein VZT92_027858 [Zoarces viviparus]
MSCRTTPAALRALRAHSGGRRGGKVSARRLMTENSAHKSSRTPRYLLPDVLRGASGETPPAGGLIRKLRETFGRASPADVKQRESPEEQ